MLFKVTETIKFILNEIYLLVLKKKKRVRDFVKDTTWMQRNDEPYAKLK